MDALPWSYHLSETTDPRLFIALRGERHPEAALTPQYAMPLMAMPKPTTDAALADLLTELKIRQELSGWRASGRNGLLVMDSQLPLDWQRAPWESLRFEGQPLAATLLTVRHAKPLFGQQPLIGVRAAWLNLFPKHEFNFAGKLQKPIAAERLFRILPRSLKSGLDGYDELFVLAHGDEHGLLDQEKRLFELDTAALPRRVWLLACNHDGAMYRLAESLLARGVRTVVAATGELSAPEIATLLNAWFERDDGVTLEDWLLERRTGVSVAGGIHALTLFGEVMLDDSSVAHWNEISWREWRETLVDVPWLAYGDKWQFQDALKAIDSPALWPKTLDRLLPQALSAAENLDHRTMKVLYKRYKYAVGQSPALSCALAHTCYRCGHYDLMADFLINGLQYGLIPAIDHAELLGAMTNLLIDMALPTVAASISGRHAECQIDDLEARDWQDFKRLDWQARIALRQQRFDEALHFLEIKRQKSPDANDTRELAWLLYVAAWKLREGGSAAQLVRYRDEVQKVLDALPANKIGEGNDGAAYLLRALACYRWSTGDEALDALLKRWLPLVEKGLTMPDPGPWAFVGCYLALSDARFATLGSHALTSLDHAGYWLEAAGLAALGVDPAREDALMKKFESMRDKVLMRLAPWLESIGVMVDGRDGCNNIPPL